MKLACKPLAVVALAGLMAQTAWALDAPMAADSYVSTSAAVAGSGTIDAPAGSVRSNAQWLARNW